MKIQVEFMGYLLVIRILAKKYTRNRSYLYLDNRKWNDRRLVLSEIRGFGVIKK